MLQLKWLTLSFGGMVTTGLASLTYVNIPMYRYVCPPLSLAVVRTD
jgi:hypothetical protein